MRAAVLALLLVSTLGGIAGAASAQTVQVRTRPDAVGDVYRFRSDTRFVQNDDKGMATQTNHQVFDLEVLGVDPDGLRLRYTLREADVTDTAGASMGAPLKAAVGSSLAFKVARDGTITSLADWPAWKARMLTRIAELLPASDPLRAMVRERLDMPPLEAAGEMVLGDVKMMAVMEPRGAVALGHTDAGGSTMDVSVTTPGCAVRIERATNRGSRGSGAAIVSQAEVAVGDGRILSLNHHRVLRATGGSQDETVLIKRVSPIPACR